MNLALRDAIIAYTAAVQADEAIPFAKRTPAFIQQSGERIHDAYWKVIQNLMPVEEDPGAGDGTTFINNPNGNTTRFTAVAAEALLPGDMVALYYGGATPLIRRALATTVLRKADGFVLDEAGAGDRVAVYFGNLNDRRLGLTPGAVYFLDNQVPGNVTHVPITGNGHINQPIGKALSATTLLVRIEDPTILATEEAAIT